MSGALVVSIHDVAPATQQSVGAILRDLASRGVTRTSLLVVPNYHHRGESMEDAAFVDWLRELQSSGHEIVIHGYYHERRRRGGESLREQLITRVYTAGEGEFFDISYDDALALIQRARARFELNGFWPTGFVAPAWLLSAEGERAAVDAGMRYTTRLTTVRDLESGAEFYSRSMVYSTRSAWRRGVSLLWNRALRAQQTTAPLVRLGIHPPDRDHANVWRAILRHAEQLAAAREVHTYAAWLDAQTASPLALR